MLTDALHTQPRKDLALSPVPSHEASIQVLNQRDKIWSTRGLTGIQEERRGREESLAPLALLLVSLDTPHHSLLPHSLAPTVPVPSTTSLDPLLLLPLQPTSTASHAITATMQDWMGVLETDIGRRTRNRRRTSSRPRSLPVFFGSRIRILRRRFAGSQFKKYLARRETLLPPSTFSLDFLPRLRLPSHRSPLPARRPSPPSLLLQLGPFC